MDAQRLVDARVKVRQVFHLLGFRCTFVEGLVEYLVQFFLDVRVVRQVVNDGACRALRKCRVKEDTVAAQTETYLDVVSEPAIRRVRASAVSSSRPIGLPWDDLVA